MNNPPKILGFLMLGLSILVYFRSPEFGFYMKGIMTIILSLLAGYLFGLAVKSEE